MAEVALAVIIFAPLVITYFLKSNAALSFLVLCVGFVLSTSVIGDLKHLLSETHLSITGDTIGLILLVLPLLVTMLITKGHTHRRGLGFIIQLVASLCVGGLLALSAGPLLASSSQFNVTAASSWKDFARAQAAIIGAGSVISLFSIWTHNFRGHKKH